MSSVVKKKGDKNCEEEREREGEREQRRHASCERERNIV
jgi:hypothetical protein